MHDKVQKPLRRRSLSLIDILDYRRHLQRRSEGDKRSLVVSYYASVCKGGKERRGKEGRTRRNTEEGQRRATGRRTDKQGERTVAPRFIQNGLNDGDNGGAQSAKRKPTPPRPFCSLRPSHPMETGSLHKSKLTRVKKLLSMLNIASTKSNGIQCIQTT